MHAGAGWGVGVWGKGKSPVLSVLYICNSLIPPRAGQNNVHVRETGRCKKSKGYRFVFKLSFRVVSTLQRRLEFPGHCNIHHMSSAIIAPRVLRIFYKSVPCGLGFGSFNLQITSMLSFWFCSGPVLERLEEMAEKPCP